MNGTRTLSVWLSWFDNILQYNEVAESNVLQYVTRSEKRDLPGKNEILHDERLKKSELEATERRRKWGILNDTSYSSPVFPHSLFHSFARQQ